MGTEILSAPVPPTDKTSIYTPFVKRVTDRVFPRVIYKKFLSNNLLNYSLTYFVTNKPLRRPTRRRDRLWKEPKTRIIPRITKLGFIGRNSFIIIVLTTVFSMQK